MITSKELRVRQIFYIIVYISVAQRKNIVLVNYSNAKLDEGLNIHSPKTHSMYEI